MCCLLALITQKFCNNEFCIDQLPDTYCLEKVSYPILLTQLPNTSSKFYTSKSPWLQHIRRRYLYYTYFVSYSTKSVWNKLTGFNINIENKKKNILILNWSRQLWSVTRCLIFSGRLVIFSATCNSIVMAHKDFSEDQSDFNTVLTPG